jgi:hypothetical protein
VRSFALVNTGAFIFVVVVSAREHLTTSRFVFVTVCLNFPFFFFLSLRALFV